MTMRLPLAASAAMLALCLAACQQPAPAASNAAAGNQSNEREARDDRESDGERASERRSGGESADRPSADAAPRAGSAQRAAIMDAMRPAVEREIGHSVEFVVDTAEVRDGWALVLAQPQRPGGGAIDDSNLTEERDGNTVSAILRFQNGGWSLVDHAIGATDVWYCGLQGPPRSLTNC